jgi:hypothetical protein
VLVVIVKLPKNIDQQRAYLTASEFGLLPCPPPEFKEEAVFGEDGPATL